ncbi:MAG: CocE/NonD family hydrolase [Anaerolineae bacterium]|nr:CocE/NonD family hydrolase [Anaerolineae bacterium]
MTVEFNVPATMRDGIVLLANVFRPVEGGPFPVLLARTPYVKDFSTTGDFWDAVRLASAGYIVVIQDVRGRAASGGEWLPMLNEARDGYDSVEWAAALPGSNGSVGMFGASYLGFTQWSAAAHNPPSLKALFPCVTWADARDGLSWRGGALELGLFANWMLGVGVETTLKRIAGQPPDVQRAAMGALVQAIDTLRPAGYMSLPLKDFAPLRRTNTGAAAFDLFFERPNARDAFREQSPAEFYDRLRYPAYNIGGWYDIFLGGALQNYTALREYGAKLLIGPWTHNGPRSVVGEMDFGFAAGNWVNLQFDMVGLTVRWFDHWLKGRDTGLMAEPPVKLFIMGENVWRDEADWPLARARNTPMFLRANGGLSFDAPGDEPPDRYTYDPADPTPVRGGALLMNPLYGAGPVDQRPVEARPDVLSYTSAPLERDVEVTGPVSVRLWAASDARDTDFVARLIDVHPDGFAQPLCDGIVRARFRDGDAQPPSLIEPGRAYEYTIDLWATANLFRAGHSIRVDVASASFPRWDRNPNTGDDFGSSAHMQPARQTILHDAAHPSRVILPVVRR